MATRSQARLPLYKKNLNSVLAQRAVSKTFRKPNCKKHSSTSTSKSTLTMLNNMRTSVIKTQLQVGKAVASTATNFNLLAQLYCIMLFNRHLIFDFLRYSRSLRSHVQTRRTMNPSWVRLLRCRTATAKPWVIIVSTWYLMLRLYLETQQRLDAKY